MGAGATIRFTWDEIENDAREMAGRLKPSGPFFGLVAVTRGGLMPALVVAHALDIRRIETVCIEGYAGRERHETRVLKPPATALGNGAGWLVVDDIADSGATAETLRKMLPRATLTAVYAKPEGEAMVDLFFRRVSQETWVVFPWEKG